MKNKLHYLLTAFLGLALIACESTESDLVEPVAGANDEVIDIGDYYDNFCADAVTYPLRIDANTNGGEVSIANDDSYLYVTVTSMDGFNPNSDTDIYLYVDTSIDDLPLNSLNFPDLDASLFDYTANVEGNEYTFMVPLEDISGYNGECGSESLTVFVAADILYNNATLLSYGGDVFVDGSAPWWYDMYTPACCDDDDNGDKVVCEEPVPYDLRIDQNTIGGEVLISNDESYLYVTVNSDDGFNPNTDTDIYLYIDSSIDNLPLNALNFPDLDPALFEYTANVEGNEYTFEIPLEDLAGYEGECGTQSLTVFLAADLLYNEATLLSYAGDIFVDGSAPWWYDTYTPACCEEQEDRCETAFAKFPLEGEGVTGFVFTDMQNSNPEEYPMLGISNRWGWAGAICEDRDYEFAIWAAAGNNDTEKGEWVGTLNVRVDDGEVEVCYDMIDDFYMSELHIYASSETPDTAAPGQYGYTMEFDEPQSEYCATFEFDGDCVWVIAHAEVCGDYEIEDDDDDDDEEEEG